MKRKRSKKKTVGFEKVIQRYIAVLTWILILFVVLIIYWRFTINIGQKTEELLLTSGNLAMNVIDGDIHSKIGRTEDGRSASYKYIYEQLEGIRDSSDSFAYAYTWRMNGEGDLVFIVDADSEDGADLGEIYPEEIPVLKENYHTLTAPVIDTEFTTDEWGVTKSVYAPIFTSSGHLDGVIGIDIQQEIWNYDNSSFLVVLVIILGLAIVVSYFVASFVSRTVMKPFNSLIRDVEKSVRSNFKFEIDESLYQLFPTLPVAFNKAAKKARKNKESIDAIVEKRTRELEKLTDAMSHREIKMRELKKEISELKKKNNV